MLAFANNGKSDATPHPASSVENKEQMYIQTDAKKAKKYEIYTKEGVFVSEGILDMDARADVSGLKAGVYLLVIGKKAYQFSVN